MRRLRPWPILVGTVALLLTACAAPTGEAGPSPGTSRPARPEPPLATVPATEDPAVGEVPAEIMASLLADAASRTGVDASAIDVVQADSVTWPDGSLGCPEPGMLYTQALVDGYHVILAAGDEEIDYRASAAGGFRVCEGGRRPGG